MLTILVAYAMVLGVGCAHVQVDAPKDPIKLDISMRLDVYQHVAKDIDDIEGIVTGEQKPKTVADVLVPPAHADDLSPEAEQAALRRRDRQASLKPLQAQGLIGQTRLGMLTARGAVDAAAAGLIRDENSDRMIIYQEISRKNGASLEDVQKVYARKLLRSVPSGTPVEDENGAWSVRS